MMMYDLIQSHKMRFMVYVCLFVLTIGTVFSIFFSTQTYQIAMANKFKVEALEDRMSQRESVANEYVPRIERMEQMYTMHETIMQGMMVRQKEITSDYLKILKQK